MSFYSAGLVDSTAILTSTASFFGLNKLTIKNNDSYYDKIRIVDTPLTDDEIDALLLTDTYVWTDDTRLLMEFDQNLLGGNVGVDTSNLERAIIYRALASDPDTLTLLDDDIDPTDTQYIDYTAINDNDYVYRLTLVDNDNKTSELFSSNEVTSEYDSFFLIDPVENISFRFNLNASSSQVSKNETFNILPSAFSKYPVTSRGLTFFDKGTINCWLGYYDEDDNFIDTVEYLGSLETVLQNGNNKYLKNRAGNIWEVQVSNLTYLADTRTVEHQRGISFDYVEVAQVNDGE